jgi:hypothetical protein
MSLQKAIKEKTADTKRLLTDLSKALRTLGSKTKTAIILSRGENNGNTKN